MHVFLYIIPYTAELKNLNLYILEIVSRNPQGLTTPNASPIEIHVKCLNSTGRFYFFLPSPLSSAAYHNEAWAVHFQKQLP